MRALKLLEHLCRDRLYLCLPLSHLSSHLSWLLPIQERQREAGQQLLSLLSLPLAPVVTMERQRWQRLCGLRERRRGEAVLALQRGRREHRSAEVERSLIETVLHKYERLQRQTESLAYSFYSDGSQLYREMQGQDKKEEQQQQQSVKELEQGLGKGHGLEEGCGQDHQRSIGRVFRALPCSAGGDVEECSEQLIRQTSAFFGLDLVRNEEEENMVLSDLDMSVLLALSVVFRLKRCIKNIKTQI
jgi:hypothetical protein